MFFSFRKKSGNDPQEHNAYIGSGTMCDGVLQFVGEMYVDGKIQGEIKSEGTLVLGKDSQVSGSIDVSELYCDGNLEGDIIVRKKAVLYKNAHLKGSLDTLYLSVEEGATVDGNVKAQEQRPTMYGKVLEMTEGEAKNNLRDLGCTASM